VDKPDFETAQENLISARANAAIAIDAAEHNAAAAAKADADRKRTVELLEEATAEIDALKDASRSEEHMILSAPAEDDGPVAPIPNDWRKRRYGGGK
jgi:hypothetical protein